MLPLPIGVSPIRRPLAAAPRPAHAPTKKRLLKTLLKAKQPDNPHDTIPSAPHRLVRYSSPDLAARAIEVLNGQEMDGRKLHVREDRTYIDSADGVVVFVVRGWAWIPVLGCAWPGPPPLRPTQAATRAVDSTHPPTSIHTPCFDRATSPGPCRASGCGSSSGTTTPWTYTSRRTWPAAPAVRNVVCGVVSR